MKKAKWFLLLVALTVSLGSASVSYGLSFTFSDKDFYNGASWGTMMISVVDKDTLHVEYTASLSPIPSGSQASGFGFSFSDSIAPISVVNYADPKSLNWVVLQNLNSIPQPTNRDEFSQEINKRHFTSGVTEGKVKNFSGKGILPGQADTFDLNFSGVDFLAGGFNLADFVMLTGVRLKNLPDHNNNGDSLFLLGNTPSTPTPDPNTPVPEPSSLLLLGSGLLGLVTYGARRKAKK